MPIRSVNCFTDTRLSAFCQMTGKMIKYDAQRTKSAYKIKRRNGGFFHGLMILPLSIK